MKKHCENCKYWHKDKEIELFGDCHAPIPISIDVKIKRQTHAMEGHDCWAHLKK